jgi:hypothetical protein
VGSCAALARWLDEAISVRAGLFDTDANVGVFLRAMQALHEEAALPLPQMSHSGSGSGSGSGSDSGSGSGAEAGSALQKRRHVLVQ